MPTIDEVMQAYDGRDFASARALCAQLARTGDVRAMQVLGRWHAAGDGGCGRDPGLAAYWFFQAWQGGLDEAETDIVRVRADLEAAADGGSAEAQNALGLLLCFGHDEPAAAAGYFELAAAQNHAEALRTLGYLFEGGKGVPQDDSRAGEFYRRAAELGDPFAQFNLAVMLDRAHDRDGALHWLTRAAEQGMAEANEALEATRDSPK